MSFIQKNKKIILGSAICVALAIMGGLYYWRYMGSVSYQNPEQNKQKRIFLDAVSDRQMVTLEIIGGRFEPRTQLRVELVKSPESITQGLSGRKEIGSDGMVFVFPQKETRFFWMKDMQFNLDLVWIADNEIVGVTKNVPAPNVGTALSDLPTYTSPAQVDMVLEVPAGEADKKGLITGVKVSILYGVVAN